MRRTLTIKRTLLCAAIGLLVVGCSARPIPVESSAAGPPDPPRSALVGPPGSVGPSGPAGAQGSTLVGPSGPAGTSGTAGTQGLTGPTGAIGAVVAGSSGPTGPGGVAGTQGPTGPVGATGPVGVVERWTSFRDILFDFDRTNIRSSETSKVSDVAAYMRQNPSLQVGLDGYTNPRSTDPNARTMRDRRVGVVRDSLIQAGVPVHMIQTGTFGEERPTCNDSAEACQQRDRRVEVLIRTGN